MTSVRFQLPSCLSRPLAARLALALLLTAGSAAHAYELKRDSSGSPVRWAGAVTFVVDAQLAERLSAPGAETAVDAAVATLRGYVGGLQVSLVPGTPETVGYDSRDGAHNQSQIVALEEWPYDEQSLAVTVVTLDTRDHRILDADIAFNAAHRRFAVLPDSVEEGGLYDDVQNTLTHELGHAMGLGHNGALPDAVMYPSARRGETRKRLLHEDDRAGLAVLYGELAGDLEPSAAGCSASGSGAALGLALLTLPLLLRRRYHLRPSTGAPSALALALLGLGGAAQASDVVRQQAAVNEAAVVATTEVMSVRTLPPAPGDRLLHSEVEVRVRECLKGSCPERMVLRVPGGRFGHIEQHVEGLQVPAAGEQVGVTVRAGAAAERPSPRATGVYRLGVMADFAAFAQGLGAAGWKGRLALPTSVSGATPLSPQTPAQAR